MAKKILKTLTNNLGFKILAVIFAFIMWLVVYNNDDPRVTQTFTTSVTLENEAAVQEMNKCYEILNGTNTVTFPVTGKRSNLGKLEDADFMAVADMSRMVVNSDNDAAIVPIEISCRRNVSGLTFNGKTKHLEIALEDYKSRRFMITADTSGKVAEGFALGEVAITGSNMLTVSGPASIVGQIENVVATIDVDGMSANLSDNVLPVLYDADGKEVDSTRLKLSSSTVTISAKVLSVKEIPLVFATTGKPAGDYRVVEINSKPGSVRLKGSSSVLNPLMSIEIPGELINVNSASADVTTTIDITEYLPPGTELVDAADASVIVTVQIRAYEAKTYQLHAEHIAVEGLGDEYEISFSDNLIPVTINGLQEDLDELTAATLKASIDVSGLGEGTHRVLLSITLDEERYAFQPVTIEIKLARKDSPPDEPDEPEDNGEEGEDSESEE